MSLLTVFTPTYNRAHTLPRTYHSLCCQTCKDFEWLIIDDGSSDNTKGIVEKWIKETKEFKIRYIYQKNQGMHGAHNTAYKNITTELNTCIDSDDWMPDNAVELIVQTWKEKGNDKIAGLIGLDQTSDGKIIGSKFNKDQSLTTLTEFYANGGQGDKKLVYRTEIIKNYPEYPIFEGEKYVGLIYKYWLVDKDYKLFTLNKPLATVEYQLDGSSYNMYSQYLKNPKGFSFLRLTEMKINPSFKRRFISAIHYVATSIISRNKKFVKESTNKPLTILAIPVGISWYFIIKSKVKHNKLLKLN